MLSKSAGSTNHRALFLRHQAQTSSNPLMLEITGSEGVYLYTADGKQYIDLISGISVSAGGHRHPAVVQAIRNQLDQYLHVMVYGEFIQGPQVLLAEKLCSMLPPQLQSVYFVNSGAEATEGAMKLAKRASGRTKIVAFEHAYHGSTQGALSLIGDEYFRRSYRPLLPEIYHIRYNHFEDLQRIDTDTACVFAETIQGEAGIIVPDYAWMKALRERCNEAGSLLVLDEIQSGMGRCGTFMAFEQFDVVPDILLLAKGLGGGLPLGAFVSSTEIMRTLSHNPVLGHITTYGGNALCCAAGLAVTELIEREKLAESSLRKEQIIRDRLRHPAIQEIRGRGLLLAAVFKDAETAMLVMKACIDKGLITDWFLFAPNCLRIAPPLTISERELNAALDSFMAALEQVFG